MVHKTDYHIHTMFSDGRSLPEDYISRALASDIKELGFSDHLTLFRDQEDWNMDPTLVMTYINHIENLRKKNHKISIKTGLEVDYFKGKEAETRKFLDNLPLDYIIGSVHFQGEQTVDMGPEFYEGKDMDLVYRNYFDTVISAVSSGLFDIIGHCDLIRIYGYKPISDPEPLYRELARAMKHHDVVFEINTNGRNRPIADFYPDRKFLHIFMEEKVPVCVNSDAHMPRRVGQYFDEAYDLLRYTGFNEMAVFSGRKRTMIPF